MSFASLRRAALGSEDVAVSIGNDGNFGALADYWRGANAGARHLVAVIGEVGIGAGVVVDGQLSVEHGTGGRCDEQAGSSAATGSGRLPEMRGSQVASMPARVESSVTEQADTPSGSRTLGR